MVVARAILIGLLQEHRKLSAADAKSRGDRGSSSSALTVLPQIGNRKSSQPDMKAHIRTTRALRKEIIWGGLQREPSWLCSCVENFLSLRRRRRHHRRSWYVHKSGADSRTKRNKTQRATRSLWIEIDSSESRLGRAIRSVQNFQSLRLNPRAHESSTDILMLFSRIYKDSGCNLT